LKQKQLWQNNNYAAAGSFVGIQYATIPDAEIKVTDEDLKKELNANKLKYKQDATRDIEFVSFSILPTSEDSAVTRNWAYDNVEKFRAYKYDSVFVNINGSEDPWDGTYKRIGSFDKSIENQLFALDSGGMIGPVYADGKYSIYKVSGTRRDSISVFKASHILVSLTTGTREDTINSQNRVNTILNDLKTGKVKFEDAAVPNADGSGGKPR
jgi:peptidyl-prolyl cis-trans isomerase D